MAKALRERFFASSAIPSYKRLKCSMAASEELEPAVADATADAMKEWAA